MLNLLIVDDEPLVRLGLRSTINWEENGFSIVGEASDAEEAFEKFSKLSPDIVITDIRMGDTSGLDLVEKIHRSDPNTELIILSGYEQFDYAKAAFERGSCAYLLKPIENAVLLETLNKIKEKITSRKAQELQLSTLSQNLPKLRRDFILRLLSGEIADKGSADKALEFYGVPSPRSGYLVAVLRPDGKHSLSAEETKKFAAGLTSSLDSALSAFHFQGFRELNESGNLILILNDPPEVYTPLDALTPPNFFAFVQKQFKEGTGRSISVGYSAPHRRFEEISGAYGEANEALALRALKGPQSITDFQSISRRKTQDIGFNSEEVNRLITSVKDLKYDETFSILDRFFSSVNAIPYLDIKEIQSAVAEMLLLVTHSLFKNRDSLTFVFGHAFHPFAEVQDYDTSPEIEAWVHTIFNKIYEDPNLFLECPYHPEIQQAIASIMQRYSEPLTAKIIADELFLTPNYLMTLFKKETGKTFNAYLTDYRINVAKKLFDSGNYKIKVVCNMVGYKDTDYFSQIFKKVTGISPKAYIHNTQSK